MLMAAGPAEAHTRRHRVQRARLASALAGGRTQTVDKLASDKIGARCAARLAEFGPLGGCVSFSSSALKQNKTKVVLSIHSLAASFFVRWHCFAQQQKQLLLLLLLFFAYTFNEPTMIERAAQQNSNTSSDNNWPAATIKGQRPAACVAGRIVRTSFEEFTSLAD